MNNEIIEKIKNRNKEILNEHGKSEMSISTVLSMLIKPFDKDGVAKKTFDKHFNNPDSQYYQMSIEQIIESWENKAAVSCDYGRKLDTYIQGTLEGEDMELWKLDNNYDLDERLHGICDGFDEFIKVLKEKTDYEDIGGEIQLFYKYNGVLFNGRTDRIFFSKSKNKFLIVDWKNSGDIVLSNKWGKLLGPLSKYDECNGNTYTLQTQFYKTALINSYPELGITEDDVDTRIVQMVYGDGLDKHYNVYEPNIAYDKKNIDNMVDFAWKKNQLLSKNASN